MHDCITARRRDLAYTRTHTYCRRNGTSCKTICRANDVFNPVSVNRRARPKNELEEQEDVHAQWWVVNPRDGSERGGRPREGTRGANTVGEDETPPPQLLLTSAPPAPGCRGEDWQKGGRSRVAE